MNDFFWKFETWMKDVMKRSEQAKECDAQITPTDSRFTTTSKSASKCPSTPGSQCTSVLSTPSSIRIKAEMERASLKAKAVALQEKLAIEKEEADWYAHEKL